MNCPGHMLIYRSQQRSYRELPLRLFEFGTVYRFERTGVLHGLTRVRGITQDDSHIFCTPEQLADELASLLQFVLRLLRTFGLTDFEAELATRPDKFVGEPEQWDEATEALRHALETAKHPVRGRRGGGRVLRAEDRRARARRDRPTLADVDAAGRLPVPRPIRPRVHRPRQPAASSACDPPRVVRVRRALLRHPPRALRRGVAVVALAGAGASARCARRPRRVRGSPRRPFARGGLPCRLGRGRRAARCPHPQGEAREDPLCARRRRRRRARRHGRRQPSRRRGGARGAHRRLPRSDARRSASPICRDARPAVGRVAVGLCVEHRGRRRARVGVHADPRERARPTRRRTCSGEGRRPSPS